MGQTKVLGGLIEGAGTAWQEAIKNSNFTASVGEGYFIDTSSSQVTVTLPSNPSSGDVVELVDYGGSSATNKILITSSNNIEGASHDKALEVNFSSTRLVYSDATKGWVTSSTSLISSALPPLTVDF